MRQKFSGIRGNWGVKGRFMRLHYKNSTLEAWVIAATVLAATTAATTFVMLYGFDRPVLSETLLHAVQMAIMFVFFCEQLVRLFNLLDKRQFLRANWFERRCC